MPAKPRARNFPPRPGPRRRELSYLIAAILASGTATHPAVARNVPFSEPPAITTGADGAFSVFTADMDGDGDVDALSASDIDGKIAWYENDGNGGGWTLHTISLTANGARAVFAADMDGDGDVDALSASRGDNKIAWYENDGNGGSWTLHTISLTADNARAVFAADVDSDGDLDALSASRDDNKIAWYENDGNGGGWTLHTISTTANGPVSVFAVDVDGDGDTDALSASASDNTIAWYENTAGDGSNWTRHVITTAAEVATSVFAADVDGDGDIDVVSSSSGDNTIAWYENTGGDGSSWTLNTIDSAAYGAQSVFATDVDGDGDIDALSASLDDSTIAWHENIAGDGSIWTKHIVNTAVILAASVTAADVDGDGDTDILSASYFDDKIAWYRNDTIHRSASFPVPIDISNSVGGARSVFAADMNRDGFIDVLANAFNQSRIDVLLGDGTGTGWLQQTVATAVGGPQGLFAADIDGDGDLDALSTAYTGDAVLWHENDGSAGGWTLHTIRTTDSPAFVSAADLDRDGDLDVLSTYGNQLAWYENDGGGLAWTVHTIPDASSGPRAVHPADMDGDGDLDALFAGGGNLVAWTENDGAGAFATLHTISTTALSPIAVYAADVDGDGDLDAVSASLNDDKIAWYENTAGDGSAWGILTVTTSADGVNSLQAADLDNDGDVDIAITAALADSVIWYENTAGDGSGWSVATITTTADSSRSVVISDLDADGDTDLIAAHFDAATVAWYENRGGQFALPTLNTAQRIVNNSQTHDLLDIQAVHRGRMGDSDAELITIELKFTDGAGVDLTSTEANNLIEELRVYLDDGSGVFEAGSDTVARTVSSFSLTAGVQTVAFGEGDPNAQLPFGSPKVYFVVADLTADADSQTPSAFQVGHITESSSTGEDAPNDIPLTLEFWPNTGTGVVDTALSTTSCKAPFDLQLANRTVITPVACEAGTFIRAGDSLVVDSGGNLSLSAGESIRFTSGFHVDEGTLTVTIEPALQP